MKPYDTSGMLESDDELESVLREYFRQEMPLELQDLADVSDEEFEKHFSRRAESGNESPDHHSVAPRRDRFKQGSLFAAICVCLIAGVIGFTQFQQAETDPGLTDFTPETPATVESPEPAPVSMTPESAPAEPEALAVIDQGNSSLEMTSEIDKTIQESIDITLYNTESGPVEQRTEISWRNFSVQNPETGSNVELSMPELTIDFVPVNKSGLSLIKDESEPNGQ